MIELQPTTQVISGEAVAFELSAALATEPQARSIACQVRKEDPLNSCHVIVMEKPPLLEPHYVDGVQRGWSFAGDFSYHVCRCPKSTWTALPPLALALGFSPRNEEWDQTELCAAMRALLGRLDCRDELSPTDVSDSYLVLETASGPPSRHDIDAALHFNETTFGVKYREIGRSQYVRMFEQRNRLILGTTF
jgi:hypothetical protein